METWTFTLSHDDIQTLPQTSSVAGGPVTRDIDENSKFARLRCIKWDETEDPTEEAWAASDTKWIPRSYFSLNGLPLEQRKKIHHGKDMPIDFTHLLREGENTLEFTVLTRPSDTSHQKYLLAVEVMGVASYDAIKERLFNENFVPADVVLNGIKRQLAPSANNDEIALLSESTLSITLFDPFSQSKYCDIPVRSKACPHNDCFDLRIFLTTRARKGGASVADQWRCPVCRGDARPQALILDGFVKQVCEQLHSMGLSNTRAIVVSKDGTWRPKKEIREGVSDDPPTPMERERNSERRSIVPADVEIIDLSD